MSALSDLVTSMNYDKTYNDITDILNKELNNYSGILTEIQLFEIILSHKYQSSIHGICR